MSCAVTLAQQYPFVYYTPKDGLISSRVRRIYQDSKGLMYFSTYSGLSRYDGVVFKNYTQEDGLSNLLVNDVVELGPDSLLIATNGEYLNKMVNGRISRFYPANSSRHIINQILKCKNGQIYVVADDGLFMLGHSGLDKIPLLNRDGKDIGFNLSLIIECKNYLLMMPWSVGQAEKVIICDREKRMVAGIITDQRITSIATTPDEEIWISNQDGLQSLDVKALAEGKILIRPVTTINHADTYADEHIYFDAHKDFWLFKNNEVIHHTRSGAIQNITIAQGLKASRISDLIVDREGNIWLTSDGNGVVKVPGTEVQFSDDLFPGVKNNISVMFQKKDTTWVYNSTNSTFYRIHKDEKAAFPLNTTRFHIANMFIHGARLYFNSDNKIYSIENKDFPSAYDHPTLIFPNGPERIELGAAYVTPDDYVIQYVATNDTLYNLYVLKNDKLLMRFRLSFAMDQFAVDRNGDLWVPTRDHHLYVLSLHPESPREYLQLKHDYSAEMGEIGARSIAIDSTGNFWIGTRHDGIYQYKFEKDTFHSSLHLTTRQGLTDNFYYYLFCDNKNQIWCGSQTGLDQLSFQQGKYVITNITKSKNIFQGVTNIISPAPDERWALTANGEIIMISQGNNRRYIANPSFFITSLMVNDSAKDITTNHFNYQENNFSIRVAAPSFKDEKSTLYNYQLKGSGHSGWSTPSNNASFNFINLAPGRYVLNMKASFPSSMYPDQTLTYIFYISPPYWNTWWFRIISGVLLFTIITLILRYFFAKKLEKQRLILENKQAMEKERTRIATDMHDDLGAGLTRIKFLSETIGFKKHMNLPVDDEVQNIRANAHDMIDKMGEIVWALNEKNDSLSDLLSYTRSYAVSYLSENGIKSVVTAPEDFTSLIVSGEFRRNIYLVVKEALHNIVKHAQANAVTIRFEIRQGLLIHIQDDGIGFDPSNTRPYSNGILNMKKRMASIGGGLRINHENGTTITLSAPLPS